MSRFQTVFFGGFLLLAATALIGCGAHLAVSSPSSGQDSSGGDGGVGGMSTGVLATQADQFLSSLGVNVHIDQGYSGASYVDPLNYLGVRAIRTGSSRANDILLVHQKTGVLANVFGDVDTISFVRPLAAAGALLSVEGPNEPNNFPISYNGQPGGGTKSWLPVAQLQRDLYSGMKSDPDLKKYPVFSPSETGAEVDNVGLQFLTIPTGAGTLMPDGTKYADYANPHNYVSSTQNIYVDNQAWQAADPTLNGRWDGLYVEFGKTWYGHYQGYTNDQLQTLPRVTTETGWDSDMTGGERVQGVVLLNTYLAQFKRGWRYTFIYQLRDGEGGTTQHQGIFNPDSTPKLAATYIHNFTTVLADTSSAFTPGRLDYTIMNPPATVHDLLLQKSTGVFELVVWSEKASGTNAVVVSLSANVKSVKVFDPTSGTSATQTLSNINSISLSLSDHPVILEVTL